MALFNAPGWMMKGGSSSGTTMSTMSDSDPYKEGKERVPLRLSNVKLSISNGKTKFVLRFTISQTGFTKNQANVEVRLELKAGGHWRYTGVLDTVNLQHEGNTISLDISNQINRSGQVKQLLTDPSKGNVGSDGKGKCYLLFENNEQICDNQIRCEIEIV